MRVIFKDYDPKHISQKDVPHPRNCKKITVCVISSEELNKDGMIIGTNIFAGYAHCGHKDEFSLVKGREISLRRALARMGTAGGLVPTDKVLNLLKTFKAKVDKEKEYAD